MPAPTLQTTATPELVRIVPREGDRIWYTHAGETRFMIVEGISDRQDYGYWKVYDSH